MANKLVTISAGELTQLYPRLPTPTSIRLLVIAPSDCMTPKTDLGLDFTPAGMTVADLEDPDLDFVALSYVWGGTKTDALSLGNTVFVEITENLQLALSDLRGRIDGPTMIWIDALSINQADAVERSSQVAMMYKIYSAARHVVVHLGHAADDSDSIPDILRALVNANQAYGKTSNSPCLCKDSTGKCDLSALGLPGPHSYEWPTLQVFFSRPWFHRSWTLQEVQAAREAVFLCEGWTEGLPLWLFSQALAAIKIFEPACYIDSAVEARLYRFKETPPLLYVLYANRTDGCGDPRDAVYAYLGVSIEADNRELLPNYDQDVRFVYHKYAEHFVRSGQGMEMLYNCCMDEAQPSMPSWVPKWNSLDWSRTTRRPSFLDLETSSGTDMHVGEDHNALITKGAIIDQIELVGSPRLRAHPEMTHVTKLCTEILIYLAELDDLLSQRTSSTKLPYEDVALAKWDTLAAESSGWELVEQALADPDFLAFYKDVIPYVEVQNDMHVFPEDRITPFNDRFAELFPMSVSFSAEIYTRCAARRSCVTTRGYLGNIDPMSQPGDAIALIQGALHPFILRPVRLESGEETYRFVGHAYLVGLEEGDAWSWSDTAIVDLHIV